MESCESSLWLRIPNRFAAQHNIAARSAARIAVVYHDELQSCMQELIADS